VERLRSQDTRQVLRFLRDLYALREKNAFTSYLVSSLPGLIQADAYTYNEMDDARGHASYKLWPNDFKPIKDAAEILGRFGSQIPMHAQWKGSNGQALKISDFLSPHVFKNKEIYNEFYRPMRIPFLMGIALPVNRRSLVTIGSHRGGKDFTERERTALNMIQPHIFQAYANAQAVTHMQAEVAQLNHVVEQIPQGLLSVDARGLIQWATSRARKLLGVYFRAEKRSHRRLPDLLGRWIRSRSCKARWEHEDERPGRMAPLVLDQGSRRLRVRMVPEGDRCVLFLEEEVTVAPSKELARLSLSPRETEVLQWVAQGKTNPEIGMILSISYRTVQKHLERIYTRLGVENRHAAMIMAMKTMGRRD
jgi:DNA-binding CsgD family transcriptional regulator